MSVIENIKDLPKIATRDSYGNALVELGKEKDNLVVLDADLAAATKTGIFKKAFPDRHIDCGIAEANMTGIAAGMSTCGKVPFISTFAMFAAGRSYEQVRNSNIIYGLADSFSRGGYYAVICKIVSHTTRFPTDNLVFGTADQCERK